MLSASQNTSKYEMLDADGRYMTLVEGTATKVAPQGRSHGFETA